ncbi:hypothetical protein D3C87_2180200 [compost metagenome]
MNHVKAIAVVASAEDLFTGNENTVIKSEHDIFKHFIGSFFQEAYTLNDRMIDGKMKFGLKF